MIINITIASLKIRLQSEESADFALSERFRAFVTMKEGDPDLTLNIHPGKVMIPHDAKKVFEAPLIDEGANNGTGEQFWEVFKAEEVIYVQARIKNPDRYPLLIIRRKEKKWQVYPDCKPGCSDPLPYPIDGLMLYYLTSLYGAIMIHASGADVNNRGWLFTGRSGTGKTTLAGIFDSCGDTIIHDDRLILIKSHSGWVMHNTPVYRNDEPRSIKLDHIWIIEHGRSNISIPVNGAEAAGLLMANCIQQNWDRDAITGFASAIEDIVSTVGVSKLQFVPDSTVRDYLLAREDHEMKSIFQAAATLLDEEKNICVTAGGYSMWPAIKPGDRVIIEPLKDICLKKGDIVALIRDGGYVAHRIIDISYGDKMKLFKTQGDASFIADRLSHEGEIAGIVREIIRSGRNYKVENKVFPAVFNRIAAFLAAFLPARH